MLCCRHAENSSVEAARSFGGETFGCYVVGMPKTHLLKQCNLFFFGEETFEFFCCRHAENSSMEAVRSFGEDSFECCAVGSFECRAVGSSQLCYLSFSFRTNFYKAKTSSFLSLWET